MEWGGVDRRDTIGREAGGLQGSEGGGALQEDVDVS